MADTKISALTANTAPASSDLLVHVDVSDTTMDAAGTDKKATAANVVTKAHGLSDGVVEVSSGTMTTVTAPSGTIVGTSDSQTLTNKELTTPLITGGSSPPSAPSTGHAYLFGAGTGAVIPHWINSGGTDQTILTSTTPRFAIGTISGTTLGTTGNKSITGVGFTPKRVRLTTLSTNNSTVAALNFGAMTSSNQYAISLAANGGAGISSRVMSTTACIVGVNTGATTLFLSAAYVSMDSDGFTINVTTAFSGFDVAYEAYA